MSAHVGQRAVVDKEVAFKGCLKDEADAREQLVQKWMSFKSADRRDVELLTCLEMSAEVGALNAANGARGNKALGSVRQVPLGPGHGSPPNETPAPTPKNGGLAKPN